ncbi:hypothetical protein [Inhella sp.]|uniref:hypothetical protein n=1 Tax=Inhella sp. TaxID=1921806 RepID=UPI0035B19E91
MRLLFTLLLAAALSPTWACSRVLVVPLAQANRETSGYDFAEVLREQGLKRGCRFEFPVVPRARLQMMLSTGQADLMIPATRTAERDALARFVPLLSMRPELAWVPGRGAMPESLAALTAQGAVRGAFVRGQSWGPSYEAMIDTLRRANRVDLVADLATVLRMLAAERAEFTISMPGILKAAAAQDASLTAVVNQLQFKPLPDLAPVETGIYLSRRSLSEAEQDALAAWLKEIFDPATLQRVRGGRAGQ